MISKLAHKSEVGATKLLGLEMGGDFAAPLGDKLFGAQKKLAPLCGEMRANFGHQKRIRPNVLTKHQCRPCGNPPNRIFATAGHCSFAPKCVSKGSRWDGLLPSGSRRRPRTKRYGEFVRLGLCMLGGPFNGQDKWDSPILQINFNAAIS